MQSSSYKIESTLPIVATLPRSPVYNGVLFADRDLAVSLAAKSQTRPPGGEVRVIYVPTGEVVFSKRSGD